MMTMFPPFNLRQPRDFQVNHIPKGSFVILVMYHPNMKNKQEIPNMIQ